MSVRYVIRPPSISRTPKSLAEALNAGTRKWPGFTGTPDFERDLFLTYPQLDCIRHYSGNGVSESSADRLRPVQLDDYRRCYSFYSSNKFDQRTALAAAGISVPASACTRANAALLGRNGGDASSESSTTSQRFIVRPLRHVGGLNYRITEDPTDFEEGSEYVQRVYPKDREYRVIYVFGDPVVTLRKKVPEGLTNEQPWNHTNGAFFQTINDWANCKLASTDFRDRLQSFPIIIHSHIVAVDVLWSAALGYVICEFNTCPGITIPANLERIVNHVKARRQR